MATKAAQAKERQFQDLVSVGPAIERDFEMMGIRSVDATRETKSQENVRQIMQADRRSAKIPACWTLLKRRWRKPMNPRLPAEKCQWWYWSRIRKARDGRKK